MAQKGGAKKLRRSGKDKGYYTAQVIRTATNKTRRARKRLKKAEHWKLVKLEKAAKVNETIGTMP